MDAFTDDIVLAVAPFLLARDLASLSQTCKRFGWEPGAVVAKKAKKGRKAKKRKKTNSEVDNATTAPTSLVNGFARKQVLEAAGEERWEKALTKKSRESWIEVYDRLQQIRTKLVFVDFFGSGLAHVDGDLSHVKAKKKPRCTTTCATAICQEVMSAGRHFASFTVTWPGYDIKIGIMRPMVGWEANSAEPRYYPPFENLIEAWTRARPEKKRGWFYPPFEGQYDRFCHDTGAAVGNINCSFLSLGDGTCHNDTVKTDWYRAGGANLLRRANTGLMKEDKKVGLLLDLDSGEMSAYLGEERIGTKVTGLAGEFCWAAVLVAKPDAGDGWGPCVWDETAVSIESLPVPEGA